MNAPDRWLAMRRLTDRLEPRVARAVMDDLTALRGSLSPDALAHALTHGGKPAVEGMIARAATTPLQLRRTLSSLDTAFYAGGHRAAASLSAGLHFDDANPFAIRAAAHEGARLVKQVSKETKAAIRETIARAVETGQPPRESAKQIHDMVGLTRRQARRVETVRAGALAAGKTAAQADTLAGRAAVKLRKERALNIARTETITAANKGQQQLWQQLQREKVLGGDAKKEWITTPDDRLCHWCHVLDGQTVPVREPFLSARYGWVLQPALHPRCRCAMGLKSGTVIDAAKQPPLPFVNAMPPGLSADQQTAWLIKEAERNRIRRAGKKAYDAALKAGQSEDAAKAAQKAAMAKATADEAAKKGAFVPVPEPLPPAPIPVAPIPPPAPVPVPPPAVALVAPVAPAPGGVSGVSAANRWAGLADGRVEAGPEIRKRLAALEEELAGASFDAAASNPHALDLAHRIEVLDKQIANASNYNVELPLKKAQRDLEAQLRTLAPGFRERRRLDRRIADLAATDKTNPVKLAAVTRRVEEARTWLREAQQSPQAAAFRKRVFDALAGDTPTPATTLTVDLSGVPVAQRAGYHAAADEFSRLVGDTELGRSGPKPYTIQAKYNAQKHNGAHAKPGKWHGVPGNGRALDGQVVIGGAYNAADVRHVIHHELAHHLEFADNEVRKRANAFLRKRGMKTAAGPVPLSSVKKNSEKLAGSFQVWEDEWEALGGRVYTGRVYTDPYKFTEVISTGMERLSRDAIGFARQDPEHFDFMLAILRPRGVVAKQADEAAEILLAKKGAAIAKEAVDEAAAAATSASGKSAAQLAIDAERNRIRRAGKKAYDQAKAFGMSEADAVARKKAAEDAQRLIESAKKQAIGAVDPDLAKKAAQEAAEKAAKAAAEKAAAEQAAKAKEAFAQKKADYLSFKTGLDQSFATDANKAVAELTAKYPLDKMDTLGLTVSKNDLAALKAKADEAYNDTWSAWQKALAKVAQPDATAEDVDALRAAYIAFNRATINQAKYENVIAHVEDLIHQQYAAQAAFAKKAEEIKAAKQSFHAMATQGTESGVTAGKAAWAKQAHDIEGMKQSLKFGTEAAEKAELSMMSKFEAFKAAKAKAALPTATIADLDAELDAYKAYVSADASWQYQQQMSEYLTSLVEESIDKAAAAATAAAEAAAKGAAKATTTITSKTGKSAAQLALDAERNRIRRAGKKAYDEAKAAGKSEAEALAAKKAGEDAQRAIEAAKKTGAVAPAPPKPTPAPDRRAYPYADTDERLMRQKDSNALDNNVSWHARLTPGERRSIKGYSSSSNSINGYLRNGRRSSGSQVIDDAHETTLRNLRSVIDKSPSPPPPEVVWRGISGGGRARLGHLKAGQVVELDAGFMSGTTKPYVAFEKFSHGDDLRLEIIPARGAWIRPLGQDVHRSEYEWLLDAGGQYEVLGIKRVRVDGHLRDVLQVRELDDAVAKVAREKAAKEAAERAAKEAAEKAAIEAKTKAQLKTAQHAAADTPAPTPVNVSGWTKVGEQKGSNPGGIYTSPDGVRHYVKFPQKAQDQVNSEALADAIYRELGIGAKDSIIVTGPNGQRGLSSRILDGVQNLSASDIAKSADVKAGFVADAYLANWDVVGQSFDNIVVSKGRHFRIDSGGTMFHRAQGGAKEFAADKVDELESLRKPGMKGYDAFKDLTEADLREQARRIVTVLTPEKLGQLVKRAGITGADADKYLKPLLGRREFLAKKFGLSL